MSGWDEGRVCWPGDMGVPLWRAVQPEAALRGRAFGVWGGQEAGSPVRALIWGHGGDFGFYPVGGGTEFMMLSLWAAF